MTRRSDPESSRAHRTRCPTPESHATGQTTVPLSGERQHSEPTLLALDIVHPLRRRIPLGPRPLVLGRDVELDVRLLGDAVSRRHAQIDVRAGVAAVTDLESRNGVYVDGIRVQQGHLRPNGVLRIGDHVAVVRQLEANVSASFTEHLPGMWGSEALLDCAQLVATVAGTVQPTLIRGESGTGKELVAHAIHSRSSRNGPFVALNCAALSPQLLEAELFGHRHGAYTGAQGSRPGLLRSASGGTVFLDELGELSGEAQAKLLRVVQTGEVLPVGADRPVRVDVRYVAATHRDLPKQIEEGRFRLDLYHRICGVQIEIPPLRQRREDILPLFQLFVRKQLGRTPSLGTMLVEALCLNQWPGNVRQLEHIASAMAAVHGARTHWRLPELPRELGVTQDDGQASLPATSGSGRPKDMDEETVRRALHSHEGNVSLAASELGVARQSLYTLTRKFGLRPDAFRRGKPRER